MGTNRFWYKLTQNFAVSVITITEKGNAHFFGLNKAVFGMNEPSIRFGLPMSKDQTFKSRNVTGHRTSGRTDTRTNWGGLSNVMY
jgi:hypothetical protein